MPLDAVKTATREQTKWTATGPRLVRLQSLEDMSIDSHRCYSNLSWHVFRQLLSDLTTKSISDHDCKRRIAPLHGLLWPIIFQVSVEGEAIAHPGQFVSEQCHERCIGA